jgi:hypothetical protein
MVIKRKKMSLVLTKNKIPRPNFDELTRLATLRNTGKKPEDFIDESYLISELVMKHTQPAENV